MHRDVADCALCGWKLPHKYFSRILWGKEHEIPGWQGPHEMCPKCVQTAIKYDLNAMRLCMTPAASWDNWDIPE